MILYDNKGERVDPYELHPPIISIETLEGMRNGQKIDKSLLEESLREMSENFGAPSD